MCSATRRAAFDGDTFVPRDPAATTLARGLRPREDPPPELVPDRPHTHDALTDAIEQAEIFVRLW